MKGWWFAILLIALPAWAEILPADDALPDPGLEARAQALDRDLRCLVCQSQSLADSDAPLARDLRVLVRRRLAAGDSDEQVKTFLVARYGEAVLMAPPLAPDTVILWLGPAFLLLAGVGAAVVFLRRRQGEP